MTDNGKKFWKDFGMSFLKWIVAFFAGLLGGNL